MSLGDDEASEPFLSQMKTLPEIKIQGDRATVNHDLWPEDWSLHRNEHGWFIDIGILDAFAKQASP